MVKFKLITLKKFKLTKFQHELLDWIIEGAEIQVTQIRDTVVYEVVFEDGDSRLIPRESFRALQSRGLIKRKWNPSIDAERWG